jgi:hypothetical protein
MGKSYDTLEVVVSMNQTGGIASVEIPDGVTLTIDRELPGGYVDTQVWEGPQGQS